MVRTVDTLRRESSEADRHVDGGDTGAGHAGSTLTAASAASGAGLLGRLRDETRDVHERLERDLDWKARIATPSGYRSLLTRWWGFHADFEPIAASLLDDEAFFGPRRKLPLLEADLHHLGAVSLAMSTIPRIGGSLDLATRQDVLGAMYVIEGSTLGGQVIVRAIRNALGFGDHDAGYAYYAGYGKHETAAMWREFGNVLRAQPLSDHEVIVRGARRTFSTLHAWLTTREASLTERR